MYTSQDATKSDDDVVAGGRKNYGLNSLSQRKVFSPLGCIPSLSGCFRTLTLFYNVDFSEIRHQYSTLLSTPAT